MFKKWQPSVLKKIAGILFGVIILSKFIVCDFSDYFHATANVTFANKID